MESEKNITLTESNNIFKSLFAVGKYKKIVSLIFAIFSLVLCCIQSDLARGVFFAAAFVTVGFVKFDIKSKPLICVLNFIWALVLAYTLWYLSAVLVGAEKNMRFSADKIALNILCVFIVYGALYFVTTNWKLSVTIAAVLLIVLSSSNAFIYQIRGKELGAMEIFSFKTALKVAGQYSIRLNRNIVYSWLLWFLLIFVQWVFPNAPKMPKIASRICVLLIETVFVSAFIVNSENIRIQTWEMQGTEVNGYYLNFVLGIRYSMIEKPDNYVPDLIEEIRRNIKEMDAVAAHEKNNKPNIIVIMDESYADLSVLGSELSTNQPVTPFMNSFTENTIRGYALSSVYSGTTANSEFEFLTGHSMAFLPENSVPYQQYINRNVYTLGWLLGHNGYKSVSTHPYHRNGWSRNRIYPYLGFSESTFIDDYNSPEYFRGYVSDKSMFDFVLEKLRNKSDEPLFLFGITMQNHGSYNYDGDNYTQTIELEGYNGEYPLAEQYLTTLHETDAAMEYFINELKNYSENTVLLFFGDHFPGIEHKLYEEIHGGTFDNLSDKMLWYKVPFLIWANFDIEDKQVECTSLNFLSKYLLETAGVELSPYHQFLADLEEVIPAMNAHGYYSKSQNDFITYDCAEGLEYEWLNRYSILQYNNLFDKKNRIENIFDNYILYTEK